MPIADSYRVTERVLEGGNMWVLKRVFNGIFEVVFVVTHWGVKRGQESHLVWDYTQYNKCAC